MTTLGIRPSSWSLAVAAAVTDAPILAVRALRYEAEGLPGALPPIAGLRVAASGVVGAAARWDATTGQTCFPDLPPGPRRILVTDPERRFLPAAITVEIPSRHPTRPTLAQGEPRELPRRTLLLRPGPGRAVPPGATAVIGTVQDAAGRGVGLARLDCAAMIGGRMTRFVTWSAADGAFVLLLPEEASNPAPVLRGITMHLPVPRLAEALAADFLAALPADLDAAGPEAGGLFRPARPVLRAPDGSAAEAPPGQMPIRPGRTIRWDILAA